MYVYQEGESSTLWMNQSVRQSREICQQWGQSSQRCSGLRRRSHCWESGTCGDLLYCARSWPPYSRWYETHKSRLELSCCDAGSRWWGWRQSWWGTTVRWGVCDSVGGSHDSHSQHQAVRWVRTSLLTDHNHYCSGGSISFFQSVCVLGYCLLPLVLSLILCRVVLLANQNTALVIVR